MLFEAAAAEPRRLGAWADAASRGVRAARGLGPGGGAASPDPALPPRGAGAVAAPPPRGVPAKVEASGESRADPWAGRTAARAPRLPMSAAETARPPRKSARKASSAAPANLSDEAANGGAGVTNNDEVLHDLNHTNNYRRRYDLLLKYLADGAEPANLQSVAKFLNPGPMATPISASKLKEGLPKRSDFLKDLHTQGLLGGLFESLIAATERASLPGKPSSIDHSDAFFTSALFVMSHIVRIASHPHPPPNISADAKRAAAVFIRLIDAAPNEAAPDNENEILVTGCGLFLELFTTGAIQDEAFDEILGTPLVHHICRSMGQIPGGVFKESGKQLKKAGNKLRD
eukprot:tig00021013_g17057.t1